MVIIISDIEVLIDDEDYEKISKYKWCINKAYYKRAGKYYFQRTEYNKKCIITLHREIIGCKHKDGKIVDHINGNTLDNRKCNLRICTHEENVRNCKKNIKNKSGYKGVYYYKKLKKYRAQICYNNKKIDLGLYEDVKDAYKAYCKAADKYHGEYANYG